MSDRLFITCNYALRCVMPIMLAGFVGLAAGSVFKVNWAAKAGLVTFLSGLPICGIGNVTLLAGTLVGAVRESGLRGFLKDVREEPRPWVLYILILLIYSILGVGGIFLILASFGVLKKTQQARSSEPEPAKEPPGMHRTGR